MELAVVNELIYTVCDNCKFAEYNENKEQIGCGANQLEVSPVKELVDRPELGISTYLLDGFNCTYKRDKDWEGTKEDAEKEINSYRATFSVVLMLQEPTTEDMFIKFVDSFNNQTYLPSELCVLICTDNYPKRSWIANYLQKNLKARYRVLTHVDKNPLEMIDTVVKDMKMIVYYSLHNINDLLPTKYFQNFNDSIVSGNKFLALEPTNDKMSYAAVMVKVHEMYHGNKLAETNNEYGEKQRVDFIVDKLKFILKDHNKEEYVRTHEQVGIKLA